ncbi:unnamed protein product [Albugo candida]|uniref:Uncharacterized protein n=1 Tax=Albugo candida TaxID=65357 RepID=A0A024G016_9STRA|nr:unnamed protein product [Albugo candida]|eukprot:CCI40196.1 unnamed protein product [Albugo candida]
MDGCTCIDLTNVRISHQSNHTQNCRRSTQDWSYNRRGLSRGYTAIISREDIRLNWEHIKTHVWLLPLISCQCQVELNLGHLKHKNDVSKLCFATYHKSLLLHLTPLLDSVCTKVSDERMELSSTTSLCLTLSSISICSNRFRKSFMVLLTISWCFSTLDRSLYTPEIISFSFLRSVVRKVRSCSASISFPTL